ncbi:hypothetical protein FJT64_006037 [Amphibalanus amphitrite]|uniref:DNA-directed RNA polymerase I subunit RPA49 n=1 Tax=Amphibalanus amphitrite TaxID=1232801 RepID=A0A6A4W374_AMPAM|nr:hypothetical protein FJT64_006037 [Amphibalanus amphitrite]KAF0296478.1 hypothetical protein FJT64_006037 [Amphibalanus amphitrite]
MKAIKRAMIEDVADSDVSARANLPKLVTFASSDNVPGGAKFASFRNTEDGSLLLTANTDRLSYVNKSQPEQLMLAVVSKSTGKARLVPLQSYHLSPALEPAAAEPEGEETPQYTWTDVGRAFGLARWQKQHQRSTRLDVGSGSRSVAQSLEVAMDHVKPAQPPAEGEETPAAPDGRMETGLVPPQNLEATEPSEVYNREDVVPGWLYKRLQNTADKFEEALKKLDRTDEYLVTQAAKWRDSDEDKFTLTMYLFYMVRLLRNLQDMYVTKSWKRLMIPEPVLEHLRDAFMERSHNGWDRSERLLDKLACHIIVVSLWIHDYTIRLEDITGITRVKLKKLVQYCALLGLTVSSGDRAMLKLPLKVKAPPVTSRRTKRVAAM